MRVTEFYENILGLTPPWKGDAVKLNIAQRSVEVRIRAYASKT